MVRKIFLNSINHSRQLLRVSLSFIIYPCLLLFIFSCQIEKKTQTTVLEETTLTQSSYYQQCQPFNLDYIEDNITVTKPWKIAYLFKAKSDPFWQTMDQGAKEVGDILGIQTVVKFTEEQPNIIGDVKKQIGLVLELVENQEIDGLIIAPEDSIQLVPIIEKATNSGMPVIVIDTPIDTDKILTFVTFNNFQGGEILGEWVIKKIQQSSVKDNKINILILEGSLHEENTIERRQGFLAGLKIANTNYRLEILDMKSAEWETKKAKLITQTWLRKFPKIDVIMAADDQMAVGASEAVKEAARSGIIITGFDGTLLGVKAIKTGKIDATIDQIPKNQINLVTQLMINYLENKVTNFPSCQLIGQEQIATDILLTLDNIDEILNHEKSSSN
ncbi:sugar ABC transporter substrate-binding protein [Cyanothece sp. BG0011]|uniref:sugar ABC transporter substrate-binding protein n=1 Tax=Cyanothece sp. BG0011 TaxID=2082950 RepID=UPI000D1D93B3|nr:sugar ABC transporter substrate-binding protein [Cyanothece sp. BG0011]